MKKAAGEKGINSLALRIVAAVFMAVGYLSSFYTSYSGGFEITTHALWISFTLYAFLLSEGIKNTSDKVLYTRRLVFFTVISEVLFDYYKSGTFFDMKQQCVMVALCIGFFAVLIAEFIRVRLDNLVVSLIALFGLWFGGHYLAVRLNCEFAEYGVLVILVFYVAGHIHYPKLFELGAYLCMVLLIQDGIIGQVYDTITVNRIQLSLPGQWVCIVPLILIWLYNGSRGPNKLSARILYYCIYPFLLAVLIVLKRFGVAF